MVAYHNNRIYMAKWLHRVMYIKMFKVLDKGLHKQEIILNMFLNYIWEGILHQNQNGKIEV